MVQLCFLRAENNILWVNLVLCEFTGVVQYCISKRGGDGWMRNESACMSSPLIDSASFPRWGQSHTSWRVKMDLIHMHRLLNASVILSECVCVCAPPTEAASRAIVQFLEVNQSEETSRGWMLLTTINLLASSGQVCVYCASHHTVARRFYIF